MPTHLAEQTDQNRDRTRLARVIQLVVYLAIWGATVLVFWTLSDPSDAMGYAIMAFYVVLPVTTLVLSVLIGRGEEMGSRSWAYVAFFSVMYLLAGYATFDLANGLANGVVNVPDPTTLAPGAMVSALGLAIGAIARRLEHKDVAA